jgi:glyoxylase I family protein
VADDDVPTIRGLHHIALRAADFDRSLRFYAEGLGCSVTLRWVEHGQPVAVLDAGGGSYIELYGGGGREPSAGPLLHFALRTPDCAAAVARAVAAGATLISAPEDAMLPSEPPVRVRYAFCAGPDGEQIEFLQSAALGA